MQTSPTFIVRAGSACLTTLLLAAPAAMAASSGDDRTPLNLNDTAAPAKEQAASGGGGVARMVVGLAVVIGVIYGLAWVLKQMKASREGTASGAGLSELSSLPLGPGRSVHLVRVGDELVLLGSAEKGVTPLRRYGLEEAMAAGLISAPGDDDVIEGRPARPKNPVARPIAALAGGNMLEVIRQRTVRR